MSARPSTMTLTKPGSVRLYSTKELLAMPPPEWLIDGILPAGGLCALYGRPGSGKTFIALDMALSVATGHHWQGHECDRGYVLYVSAEGNAGIGKRVRTWLDNRQRTPTQARVAWLIEPIYVHEGSDQIDRLIDRIQAEVHHEPSLVVVDTLARCFLGDENQQEDMGRFVAGIDRLRLEWGATALVVHHTRLDGDRERGNTAFRGAADTMLSVSRQARKGHGGDDADGGYVRTKGATILHLECNKQKDAAEFDPKRLKLLEVADTDSCVIEDVPDPTMPRLEVPEEDIVIYDPEAKMQRLMQILLDHDGVIAWADWLSLSSLPKASFARLVNKMRDQEVITGERGTYRITGRPLK